MCGMQTKGAPGSPAMWNISLGRVLAPILRQWHEEGLRMYVPSLTADRRNRLPNNWADKAGWITHVAYVDDITLVPNRAGEVRRMHHMLIAVCHTCGLGPRDDKL